MQKTNYCCGLSLESLQFVGFIIGYLETLGGLIGTIICSAFLVKPGGRGLEESENNEIQSSINENGIPDVQVQTSTANGDMTGTLTYFYFLLISIFQTVISIILIQAILKGSKTLMTVWFGFKTIFGVLLPCLFFLSILPNPSKGIIIFHLIVIYITAFYLDVILSLRRQIILEAIRLPTHDNLIQNTTAYQ